MVSEEVIQRHSLLIPTLIPPKMSDSR
jgi:hypothetical protein